MVPGAVPGVPPGGPGPVAAGGNPLQSLSPIMAALGLRRRVARPPPRAVRSAASFLRSPLGAEGGLCHLLRGIKRR